MADENMLSGLDSIDPSLTWRPSDRGVKKRGQLDQTMSAWRDDTHFTLELYDPSPRFRIEAWRIVRETPAPPTPDRYEPQRDVTRLYARRLHTGDDLTEVVRAAAADRLEAREVAGLVLWPTTSSYTSEGWTDDSSRFMFERQTDGTWRWKATLRAGHALASLFTGSGPGGAAATLPEAVADAIAAPARITALLDALRADLLRADPTDPWLYAATIVTRDSGTHFVGPEDTLLELKQRLTEAESPLIGTISSREGRIVAVPASAAAGLDAAALVAHPQAISLKRY